MLFPDCLEQRRNLDVVPVESEDLDLIPFFFPDGEKWCVRGFAGFL